MHIETENMSILTLRKPDEGELNTSGKAKKILRKSHPGHEETCLCAEEKRKKRETKNRAEAGEKEISKGGEGPQSRRPHSAVLNSESNT